MTSVAGDTRQQEILQPGRYLLRHIAPKAAAEGEPGIVNPRGAGFSVLGQTLYADELPVSRLPSSPDFSEGKYTLRLLDAGDFELVFPNKDASDGQPWRSRFSVKGHTEFVEISREGEIEKIGVIVKKVPDRQKVVISGFDGFFLLKKNFEQEYTAVIAPRDLIERYSTLSVVAAAADITTGWVSATQFTQHEGTITPATSGGLLLKAKGNASESLAEVSLTGAEQSSGRRWQATAVFAVVTATATAWTISLGRPNNEVSIALNGGTFRVFFGPSGYLPLPGVAVGDHTLFLESDGRWLSAYVDGLLVGYTLYTTAAGAGAVSLTIDTLAGASGELAVQLERLLLKEQEPFLMRGTEKGDYVLPGTASSYPTGGLHGRYIVNGATTNAEEWWQRILAPDPRRSGFPEYLQDQQAVINNPKPNGVPAEYFAARWFGAVYLDLEANAPFDIEIAITGLDDGCRLWIGKTQFGQQIIDDWNTGTAREKTAKVKASQLGAKKGWFPIILEYFQAGGSGGITLNFFPGVGWIDPGGTVIKAERQIIPATSLSPLGCVDARIQGSSFFDLVQETAKNFGYQLRAEPRQLESGEFPCALIPQARVGIETDERIEADDSDRRSGINNYTATEDATDSAGSVKAFGSGIADGKGSQIAFEALDIEEEATDLFDLQAWVSAGDIAFPALLQARAEAELAVRLGFWQNIEGEPIARDRLADTFPLTGALAQFRWRPGDGVRLYLPDVSVIDTTNRQIMQVVRSFGAEGRTDTQIGFRARPKDPLSAQRVALREISRPQRAYQKQYVPRKAEIISGSVTAGSFTGYANLPLFPQDKLISAQLMITLNASSRTTGVEINGTERTTELGGPWSSAAVINVLPVIQPISAAEPRVFLRLKNTSASENAALQAYLLLVVLV